MGKKRKVSRERKREEREEVEVTYKRYGNTMLPLKVSATQMRLSGSWSAETCEASEDAF